MPSTISVSTPVQSVAITENSYNVSVVGDTATVSVSTTAPAVNVATSTNTFTINTIATKTDVGLGSVDNTSDANKPISTATQTALNLKANAANPSLTGTATVSTNFGITYNENNDRTYRPYVQSTTGNASGWRVRAPNTTTSASSSVSVGSSSDQANNKFLSLQATGSTTDPLRIVSGKYTADVFGPSGNSISVRDGSTVYATMNPAGPTNSTDFTTKTYVDGAISSAVAAKDNTDEITEGSTNLYFTTARARGAISVSGNLSYSNGVISYNTPNTDGINEGSTNLYHTTARARGSVSGGTGITYSTTDGIINVDTSTIATRSFVQSQVSAAELTNTDGLDEGTTNLYYTNARVRAAVSAGTGISYNNTTGVITNTITQYTDALARGAVSVTDSGGDGSVSYNSTTGVITYTGPSSTEVRAHLSAGTGLTYATGQFAVDTSTIATRSYADSAAASAAAAVVDAAPGTLDTLNELAAALGDDPNFATTVSTSLGNKLNTADFNTTADGWLAGKTTTNLTEGTNLYYTDARARGAVSAGTGISYNSSTGVITNTITQYTDALARGALSAGTGVGYDSSTGVISIGQAVGTGDNPAFAGVTGGNLSVGVSTDNTIVSTDTNGNIILAPNGTGNAALTLANGGNLTNTRNYVMGTIRNSTTASIGDIWALNSTGPVAPYRGISLDNSADTAKGPGTVLRAFSGGAVTGTRGRVVFEKARGFPTGVSTGPAALAAGDLIGTIDATGYTSTGWVNDNIITSGGVTGFMGFNATESWVSNTNLGTAFALTMAPQGTTITSGANLANVISAQPEVLILKGDRVALAQSKTLAFNATGCSVSGTTLTIGTLTTGTIATGQVVQLATGSPINGLCIIANISGSGSGSTWTLSGTPGTLSALSVNGFTGFFSGPSAGTTSDALQNLRLIKNTILSSNGTAQVITSSGGSTLGLRGDVININNAANTSTYATFGPTSLSLASSGTNYAVINTGSATFTNTGINQMIRQGSTGAQVPALLIRYQRTDQTGSQNNDGVDFRLSTGGTSTSDNIARFDAIYKSSGDNEIGMSVSADSFVTDTDRIYVGSRASTKIRATPAGGGSISDIMEITDAKILNNRAHRNAITTGTVARGDTYSVPASANGSISLTITAGSAAVTYVDVDAVASDTATGGMYSILIYNNSGDNNIDVQVRNNGANIGLSNNLDIEHRAMASVYVVGDYAACEIMDAA
jgi:hypothetical protein